MGIDTKATDAKTTGHTEPKLLALLVCPLTKGPLKYDAEANELISLKARVAYPIRNGVPLMTAEAARPLDEPEPSAPAGGKPEAGRS